jgi:hypothetical protein
MTVKSLIGEMFGVDYDLGPVFHGQPVGNLILPRGNGRDFYANSLRTGASTGSTGRTLREAASTIDSLVARCTAGRGDRIIALPGHVETITAAAGLALDVAGVTVIGLGTGSLRPKINFTTDVAASVLISAANVSMHNFLFTGGIDALTGPISIDAADATLTDIETRDVTGQATDFIVTSDNADRFRISGWKHLGAAAAGADTAITTVGGDDWVIEDFDIYGNFAVGAIENLTTLSNRVRIGGGNKTCRIWTENAADIAITMKADTTGWIEGPINIMLQDNAANITECIVAAAMQLYLPLNVANLAGEVGMTFNGTASTDA